jgi:uncharacterized BrkB/YihY/UPF0761 family membrane protein
MGKRAKPSLVSVLRVSTEIAWYGLFVIIAILVVVIVAYGFFIPMDELSEASSQGKGEFTINADFLNVTFEKIQVEETRLLMVGSLGVTLIALTIAQVIVGQLRKIFASLAKGTPFNPENSKRIRLIGCFVIIGAVIKSLVALLVGFLVMNTISIPGVEFEIRVLSPLNGVFVGLVIFVLGEIFRKGTELQEDRDLTV